MECVFQFPHLHILQPLQDTVISPGSIVMIVYTVPSNEESEKVGHRLAETIGSVVAKVSNTLEHFD